MVCAVLAFVAVIIFGGARDPGAEAPNYTLPDLEPHRGRPQTRYGGVSRYVQSDPV